MKKGTVRTAFVCQHCGYETGRWLGRCPTCGQWHSFAEEKQYSNRQLAGRQQHGWLNSAVCRLDEMDGQAEQRLPTGIGELDRVLGGGLVPGSLILLGGDPGVGKSTLALQLAISCAGRMTTLYVSGEESAAQVRGRCQRLAGGGRSPMLFLADTVWENIVGLVEKHAPQLLIIDSVQTIMTAEGEGTAGSVSQIREVAARLLLMAKSRDLSVVIIGHVTKDGIIAGPRLLEHMVDVVLYVTGDRSRALRLVRAEKNRFGPTAEIGIFTMAGNGLVEVVNPSRHLIGERPRGVAGSVITTGMEGRRPILIEVQALVCESCFGVPRRTADGFDGNRLALLLAVLDRRAGLPLGRHDVYLNVVGGLSIGEPAADLAVAVAVASAASGRVVTEDTLVCGELGLTGEVRAVTRGEERLREAAALGFSRFMLPAANCREEWARAMPGELVPVDNVRQAIRSALAD
ncbi:MAG: DNA repair protein RadA [Negativicutes bacterium]|nr:DNA repair protein RadA [Negativicutes bacterium]